MTDPAPASARPDRDPLWYKNAIIYQCHVRAFHDSDGNGIGDFRGLTEKLDYLQALGVTAVWLLPFYPSPLRDDGYDIADYCAINPIYGDLADFREFLRQAHRRGLRVIIELVVNHTSDQHPWFQRSRAAKPGSKWRDFYVWSDTVDRYADARIIFKDFETSNWAWDPVADAYYWHRFYSHQPDLNFANPLVHREVLKALDFWLDMGVDGLRLDAVPYLYEEEGTNCENLPQTHAFLKKLRQHVDEKYGDRMLLAEANQWPEDAVAYFGSGRGDECHMAFHFPLMPRLFMSVRMEDRFPIVDILDQTPPIPGTSQWAVFLRNHDELTLEMVTDEERDYMYRVYARDPNARINLGIRRRLAPLLGNDRKRTELLNALLCSLPGTPVLYYGDEIGMGENTFLGDRNGVRTPMQWSSDRNAGFSRANPQALYLPVIVDPEYHYQTVNVEAQQSNPHSLLWWMRRLLALRKQWRAFGQGTLEWLQPENRKILAYVRRFEQECVLVVANLSRFVQPVELDLSAYQQLVPVEIFGRTPFPVITANPYSLTLSPHSFFWFSLELRAEVQAVAGGKPAGLETLPLITVAEGWEDALAPEKSRGRLETVLRGYIKERRWFGGKGKEIKAVRIQEAVPVPVEGERVWMTMLEVEYVDGDPDRYSLPMAFAGKDRADSLYSDLPQMVVARLQVRGGEWLGVLYDGLGHKPFCKVLLDAMARRRSFRGSAGVARAGATAALRPLLGETPLEPSVGKAEQSNTGVVFGDRLILKAFRRLETGVNPDLEVGRFLTARRFDQVPALAGSLEYESFKGDRYTLGVLHKFVANAKDGWEYTLDALSRYYERLQPLVSNGPTQPPAHGDLVAQAGLELPADVPEVLGTYVEAAQSLGLRTGELHRALGSEPQDKDFAPEVFTLHYQRSLYQSMRNQFMRNFQLLRRRQKTLPEEVATEAQAVLGRQEEILKRFRAIYERRLGGMRIRCHGDYHLGQVLQDGKDFVIFDFEGEPARHLSERRIKRTPLRDVAGMLRSFHYAAYAALFRQMERGTVTADSFPRFEPWARHWYFWVSVIFLRSYLPVARQGLNLLPKTEQELKLLLEINLLDKAVYELGYELNNRPQWLRIPLQGILQLADTGSAA